MVDREFLLEEYKAKWEYLRHTEEMEDKTILWYLAVVGGVLSFTFRSSMPFDAEFGDASVIVPLLFLVVYSFFMNAHLLLRKANYKRYNARILYLEETFCDFVLQRPRCRFMTVFRTRFLLVVAVGAGCASLLVHALGQDFVASCGAGCLVVALSLAVTYLGIFAH